MSRARKANIKSKNNMSCNSLNFSYFLGLQTPERDVVKSLPKTGSDFDWLIVETFA